jgi:hypothetical protein
MTVVVNPSGRHFRPTPNTNEAKREHWRAENAKKGEKFLGKHMIPVILGPKHRHYVIDHHHLARALHDEGVKNVAVTVIANLSKLDRDTFWFVMDCHDLTHTFVDGRRRPYSDLPKSVDKLIDDPFRSLAGCDAAAACQHDAVHTFVGGFFASKAQAQTVEAHFEDAPKQALNWPKRGGEFPARLVWSCLED